MKTRKLFPRAASICLVLIVAVLALTAACAEPAPAPAPTTPAPTTPAPTTPEPEVIKLIFAVDGSEKAAPVQVAGRYMDAIEEKSGGRVKFDRFYNGVLGKAPEMLNLLSTGSVDITNLLTGMFKEKLPLHNFPHWQLESADNALVILDKLYFSLPEVASILKEEQTENNIKVLYINYLGENGILFKDVVTSLAEVKGKKLGSGIPQKAYEALGANVINVQASDMYEALSRGVCDCTPMPIEPMVAMKWYEVAKCYLFDGSFAAGQQFTINLNTWNSLPADIQKLFEDEGPEATAYSIEAGKIGNENNVKIFEDAGVVVSRYSAEDCATLYKLNYQFQAEEMIEIATKVGKLDEANTIMKYVDELTWGK